MQISATVREQSPLLSAALNKRNDPLLGKVNRTLQSTICSCALFTHEGAPKPWPLKAKAADVTRAHCPDFILDPVGGSC